MNFPAFGEGVKQGKGSHDVRLDNFLQDQIVNFGLGAGRSGAAGRSFPFRQGTHFIPGGRAVKNQLVRVKKLFPFQRPAVPHRNIGRQKAYQIIFRQRGQFRLEKPLAEKVQRTAICAGDVAVNGHIGPGGVDFLPRFRFGEDLGQFRLSNVLQKAQGGVGDDGQGVGGDGIGLGGTAVFPAQFYLVGLDGAAGGGDVRFAPAKGFQPGRTAPYVAPDFSGKTGGCKLRGRLFDEGGQTGTAADGDTAVNPIRVDGRPFAGRRGQVRIGLQPVLLRPCQIAFAGGQIAVRRVRRVGDQVVEENVGRLVFGQNTVGRVEVEGAGERVLGGYGRFPVNGEQLQGVPVLLVNGRAEKANPAGVVGNSFRQQGVVLAGSCVGHG